MNEGAATMATTKIKNNWATPSGALPTNCAGR